MKRLATLLLASSIIALTGCDDDDDDVVINTPPPAPAEFGSVRVIHASQDAPKVNVYVDDALVLEGVDYQQASALISLETGTYQIRVDGLLADGSAATVFDGAVTLEADTEYNVVAAGSVAQLLAGSGDTPFGPIIAPRAALSDSAMTDLRLQVIHAASDVGRVALHVTGPDDELSAATELTELSFGEFTADPVVVAPGNYRVRLTDVDDATMVAYDSGALDLSAPADLFIAATSNTQAGAAPVNLLVADNQADEAGNDAAIIQDAMLGSALRATHGINFVGGVDIWVNGAAPAMDSPLYNLMFGQTTPATGFLDLPADTYQIQVAANATTTVLIDIPELMLAPGMAYSATAVIDADGNPSLWAVAEDLRSIATEARLRVLHGSESAGEVDIYLSADIMADDGDIKLSAVPYLADSGILSIPPASYYLLVTPAGMPEVVAIGPAMINLEAGKRYTAIATDDPMNVTGLATDGIGIGLILQDAFVATEE